MTDGQKTRWIVTIEVEMNISDEQVIEEAVDLVRWHYQPKKSSAAGLVTRAGILRSLLATS